MRYPILAFLTFLAARPAWAELPSYDPYRYCGRVADAVGGSEQIRGACLQDEQTAYDQLKPSWDGLPVKTRSYCDRVAQAVGSSFQILEACVRDEQQAAGRNEEFQFKR